MKFGDQHRNLVVDYRRRDWLLGVGEVCFRKWIYATGETVICDAAGVPTSFVSRCCSFTRICSAGWRHHSVEFNSKYGRRTGLCWEAPVVCVIGGIALMVGMAPELASDRHGDLWCDKRRDLLYGLEY